MDPEADQCISELVRDNSAIAPPWTFAGGYHLTAELVDQSIRSVAGHRIGPWPN